MFRLICCASILPILTGVTDALAGPAGAGEDAPGAYEFVENIFVMGDARQVRDVPGSATLIDEKMLEKFEYQDINRALRAAPGVYLQEEDGFGLRPNIGLRGTGMERSAKITLMEDGVLVAPAPYAAPAAYYFPTAARMDRIEVRKGAAAIKYGPRSVGGAINLVSYAIPNDLSAQLNTKVDSVGGFFTHARAGGSTGRFGIALEYLHAESNGFKVLDSGGGTGFNIDDAMVKFRLSSDTEAAVAQWIEVKLGDTSNNSDETYLGLTDADFAATPYRRYSASAMDRMETDHRQYQITHHADLSDLWSVSTQGYWNTFSRDWFKLDDLDFGAGRFRPSSVFNDPAAYADVLAVFRGEADSVDDALQLRHNNRQYYSRGIQGLVDGRVMVGEVTHNLEIGIRYHEDEEDRLQHREKFAMRSGTMVRTGVDAPGSHANREAQGRAWAVYVEDRIAVGDWQVTPGVRFESIDLRRIDYEKGDATRAMGATRVRDNHVTAFVPGIGVTYDATANIRFLVGVNKGFNPPAPGSTDAREETSLNLEAGLRYASETIDLDVIGFFVDYTNILGTCTASQGCSGGDIGDQFNGGAVKILGLEAKAGWAVRLTNEITMPVSVVYTLTDTAFQSNFSDGFWGTVATGDELPYIPAHQLHCSVGLEHDRFDVTLSVDVQSAVRTTAGSGPIADENRIGARAIVDLAGHFRVSAGMRLFLGVDNLLDKAYAVARRPYGLRPGKPRTAIAGLKFGF